MQEHTCQTDTVFQPHQIVAELNVIQFKQDGFVVTVNTGDVVRVDTRNGQYLAAATHSQWLSRMLVNLQHIFATQERRADLAAMSELQTLLDYSLY